MDIAIQTPIYTDRSNPNDRLSHVVLSVHKRPNLTKALLCLLLLLVATAGFAIVLSMRHSMLIAATFGVITFVLTFAVYRFMKRFCAGELKGDALILRNLNNQSIITNVNSVRYVRTYFFLGVQCTRLQCKVDGQKYTSLLIGNPPGISISTENYLRGIIRSKKKQKANL